MAVATAFTAPMTSITGNTGGAIQALPNANVATGKERVFIARIALASQVAATVIGIARLPVGATITGISYITDTSLGSTTIALGDTNSGAIYAAAQTLTSTETPTGVGKTATRGVPITSGYDCVTGLASTTYEDIVLTTAAATAPSSGVLCITIHYMID